MSQAAAGATSTYRTRVEWIDTDAAGIYHNAAVTRYVEAAEAALMREHDLPEYFGSAPRVRYEVTFEAPLRFDQEVTAVVRIARIGRSSMTFDFEVFGETHADRPRVRAAHGSYTTVHITRSADGQGSATSTPWPTEWVESLGGAGS